MPIDGRMLLAVAGGALVGASARWAVAEVAPARAGRFPWSTFAINVTGSFLLGLVLARLAVRPSRSPHLRALLGTGVLGAYTTMSTYAIEVVLLVDGGHASTALTYALASVVAGVGAAIAGHRAGRGRG